jgi:hypothetical protein
MLKFTSNARNYMREIQRQVLPGINRIPWASLSTVAMILTVGAIAAAETADGLRISDEVRQVVAKNDRLH